jgi:hypothetical protein
VTIWTGTAPTFAANDNATVVANLNTLRDAVKAASEAWTAYVPTWTAVTANPVLGNGTLTGAYMQVNKLVTFRLQLTMGSTTTYGTGGYIFTLPVAAAAGYVTGDTICNGTAFDSSASQSVPLSVLRYTSSTTVTPLYGGNVTSANPYTFATSDKIAIYGSYEAA